jgi:hypothetical protein
MQNQETLILLGINTIIVVIVLFILFRIQDNKIKIYIKKLEKKLLRPTDLIPVNYDNTMMYNMPQNLNQNINQNNDDTQLKENNNIKSDMDSYIDPMNENKND